MPVWASVLVTVVTGLGAGTLGAGLTAWNDRQERFRDRLIEAADEFTAAAAEALVKLRDAVSAVREANDAARMKSSTEEAWEHHDAALCRSARVDLLFGPGSATASSASAFLSHLAQASAVLRPPDSDADGAERALVDGTADLQRFHRAAFDEIRRAAPPSATLRESLRWRSRRRLGRQT